VDDDAERRGRWVEQLAFTRKFEIHLRSITAPKGVQAAKAGQIDLVIMDVGLPTSTGAKAVRILRKERLLKAPISSC